MKKSILAASSALALVLSAGGAWAGGQPSDGEVQEVWIDPLYVQPGDTLTGTLAEGDSRTAEDGLMDRYIVDLQAGTRVEIVMRSEAFDTFLIAGFLGVDGYEQIALDDDGLGEGLNSRLRFTAAETGRYEIRARGFAAMGDGDYTLVLGEQTAANVEVPGSLAVGGVASGVLSDDDPAFDWAPDYRYDAYRFQAQAGDSLEAVLRSTDFDTTLMLIQESRWGVVEQLLFDDDGAGEGTNSRVRFFAPEDGEYSLRVSSFAAGETGAYTLDLSRREPPPTPTSVTLDLPVMGTIASGDPLADDGRPYDAFQFEAVAGQRLEIRADSSSFPTAIELGRIAGVTGWETLAFGDNYAAERTESRLLFTPEQDGTYVLRMAAADAEMRGDYTLSITDRGPLPPPPPPGSISVGDSVTGTLDEGDGITPAEKYFDEYDIHTTAGQRLSVTLASANYDTYVEVYRRQDDGDYALVIADDDSAGDLDSRALMTTEADAYRVRVTSYSAGETGDYALSVRDLGPPATPARFIFNRSVEGEITDRDALTETEAPYDSYGFNLAEGERAQFTAQSDHLDTFLIVARRMGDRFEFLAFDDDGMGDGTTNSRLTVTADQTGTYELWVMPLDPASRGRYRLQGRNLGPIPDARPIEMGATVRGHLRDGDGITYEGSNYDGFSFQGAAGQRIRIEMNSDSVDAFLLLGHHGPDGLAAIAENDDISETNTNAAISFTLPENGLYEVWATSFAPGETGGYSMTLSDLGPEPGPGSLLIGSTIRGALTDQDPIGTSGSYHDAYRFDGDLDHTVRITATSNAFDAYLELGRWQDGVFTPLAEDDDGLSDLNSLLTVTLPETGSYVVRVRSYSPSETGDYVLTVEEVPPI